MEYEYTKSLLRNQAEEACKSRKHTMGTWKRHSYYSDTVEYCHCVKCDMQVVIDADPAPNGIDIGGEAVAMNCGSPSRWTRDEEGRSVLVGVRL